MTKEREKEVKDYEELLKRVDKLSILCMFDKTSNIESTEFNKWVRDIISFYGELGINLQNEVFNNDIFPQIGKKLDVTEDVREYMKSIYKNDNPNIDKYLINQVLKIFKDIYFKYRDSFNKLFNEVNGILKNYGIQRVTINNINEIMKCLRKRIKLIYDEDKTKDIFLDEETGTFNIIDDVCNKLTCGKFTKMNSNDKDRLYGDLPMILEIIVKYKQFDRFRNIFDSYNKESNIQKIFSYDEEIKAIEKQLYEYVKKTRDIANKKTGIIYPSFAKVRNVEKNDKEITKISKELLALREKLRQAKQEYVEGFYKKVDPDGNGLLHKLSDVLGINLTPSGVDLMGVFPIEMLPPNDDNINNMEIFRSNMVKVPMVKDNDFIKLCDMCMKLLNSEEIKNLDKSSSEKVRTLKEAA